MDGAPLCAPSRMGLISPGREVNTEEHCTPRDQPEKQREGEGERGRERIDMREAKLVQKPHNFIFKRYLYTLSFT